MSGTVNIARSLFLDEAFKDQPFTEREAFMWLVMEASWKDRTKRVGVVVIDLRRGQLAASMRFMADAWGWEKSTVDRFLKRLEKRDMIGTESGTGISVITIRKYNDYQGAPTASGSGENEKRDSSGTAAGQTRTPEVIPEASLEEERDTDVSLVLSAPEPASPIAEAVRVYNETADATGWPKVQTLSPARSKALKARLRDCGGIEGWRVAMDKGKASDFLCGRTPKVWTGCGFDWITKQANFAKLMEGNYDNRDNKPQRLSQGGKRPDPALEQILRLTGLSQASVNGGGGVGSLGEEDGSFRLGS